MIGGNRSALWLLAHVLVSVCGRVMATPKAATLSRVAFMAGDTLAPSADPSEQEWAGTGELPSGA